jgi:hypothetical protein
MRRITQAIVTALPLCVAAGFAQAALIDRGGGLIYDTTQNITWLQNANPAAGSIYDNGWSPNDGRMSFEGAKAWAASYNYFDPLNGVTYSDWRLPQGYDLGAPGGPPGPNPWESSIGCNYSWNGADCGYNESPLASELIHLFYVSLGNLGMYDTNGTYRGGFSGVDWGLVNAGPFINLQNYVYWSAVINPADPTQEWRHFYTLDGRMSYRLVEEPDVYAWAVADGDIAGVASLAVSHAPEPETYAMLLAGLGVLGFVARRNKRSAAG